MTGDLNTPLPVRVEAPGHRHGPLCHLPVFPPPRRGDRGTAVNLARLACSLRGDGRSDVMGLALALVQTERGAR